MQCTDREMERLLVQYEAFFWRVARNTVDRDIEDAVQDVRIAFPAAYRSFESGNLDGWLWCILRRTILKKRERGEWKRQRQEREAVVGRSGERSCLQSGAPTPVVEDSSDRVATRIVTSQWIKRLHVNRQCVIVMHFHEGKSYREIAALLNIPINTVRSRIHRAKKDLRRIATEPEEDT